jgi:hypothetical protein
VNSLGQGISNLSTRLVDEHSFQSPAKPQRDYTAMKGEYGMDRKKNIRLTETVSGAG